MRDFLTIGMLPVKLTACIILLPLIVACASIERQKQRPIAADVFNKQGEYELDSSFRKRQKALAAADEFFASITPENCLHKIGFEHICHRGSSNGDKQTYINGATQISGSWKRHHNAFCINNSCKPVTDYIIQPYGKYRASYPEPKPQQQNKSIEQLQQDRIELVVRSIACYKCKHDNWKQSGTDVAQGERYCAMELNHHKSRHGAINIQDIQVVVFDNETGNKNIFYTKTELLTPQNDSKVVINSLSAYKADICDSQLSITKTL